MSLRDSKCKSDFTAKYQKAGKQKSCFSSTDLKSLIPFIREQFLDFKRTATLEDLLRNIRVDYIRKNALGVSMISMFFTPVSVPSAIKKWLQIAAHLKTVPTWKRCFLCAHFHFFSSEHSFVVVKPRIYAVFMEYIKNQDNVFPILYCWELLLRV